MAFLPLLQTFPSKEPISWKSSPSIKVPCSRISCSVEIERGVEFETGGSFFRRESAIGRDLGVLSAVLHRRALGGAAISILDAMCGCGVRSLRYLQQADAGFVWANDADEQHRRVILSNLSRADVAGEGMEGKKTKKKRWVISHSDANRVFAENYVQRVFFDMVDIDSFGSDSAFLRSAITTVKVGGLLYLTSTDGYTSGGHRPQQSLDAYGAYIRPMPYSNEIGLRMLIGGAMREAAALGFHLVPLFSYYSYHGPVFRVMLRLLRGKLRDPPDYRFIGFCNRCGNSRAFSFRELGRMSCSCCVGEVSGSLVVSGPLWTGPLHDGDYVGEMVELAREMDWTDLESLLKRMQEESDPRLTFGYIKVDEIARRGKINSPPLSPLISALQKEGYAASRSHISLNAVKTNCSMATCIEIAKIVQRS